MRPSLERRAKAVKSRAAIRSWEYRQRHHAKGTWFQLRRLLADASHIYILTERAARELMAEGYLPEPVGARLEPKKVLLFVPAERVEAIADRQEIPVRIGVDFLAARYIAMVRFEIEEADPW